MPSPTPRGLTSTCWIISRPGRKAVRGADRASPQRPHLFRQRSHFQPMADAEWLKKLSLTGTWRKCSTYANTSLTTSGGDPGRNDLNSLTGNHHRYTAGVQRQNRWRRRRQPQRAGISERRRLIPAKRTISRRSGVRSPLAERVLPLLAGNRRVSLQSQIGSLGPSGKPAARKGDTFLSESGNVVGLLMRVHRCLVPRACEASAIDVQIDDGPRRTVAYGTSREDTAEVCGDDNNSASATPSPELELARWESRSRDRFSRGPRRRRVAVRRGHLRRHQAFGRGLPAAGASGEYSSGQISRAGSNPLAPCAGPNPTRGFRDRGEIQPRFRQHRIQRPGSAGGGIPASLESPQQGSSESGIGLIRGWVCEASAIDVQIDDRAAPHRWPRRGTMPRTPCGSPPRFGGDDNNGFGYTFLWNALGATQPPRSLRDLRCWPSPDGAAVRRCHLRRQSTKVLGADCLRRAPAATVARRPISNAERESPSHCALGRTHQN